MYNNIKFTLSFWLLVHALTENYPSIVRSMLNHNLSFNCAKYDEPQPQYCSCIPCQQPSKQYNNEAKLTLVDPTHTPSNSLNDSVLGPGFPLHVPPALIASSWNLSTVL